METEQNGTESNWME